MNQLNIGLEGLARRLDQLQAVQNDGRGVSCVRAVSSHLVRGESDAARRVAEWDSDKIAAYPAIVDALKQSGLVGERYLCGYGYCTCEQHQTGLICADNKLTAWREAGSPDIYRS